MQALLLHGSVAHNLPIGVTTIGRAANCQIRVFEDVMMSRYHCRVVWNGETLSADDNDSTHGILVNDQLVASQVLKQGDVLICGVTAFTVQLETGERIESPTAAG